MVLCVFEIEMVGGWEERYSIIWLLWVLARRVQECESHFRQEVVSEQANCVWARQGQLIEAHPMHEENREAYHSVRLWVEVVGWQWMVQKTTLWANQISWCRVQSNEEGFGWILRFEQVLK